MTFLLIRRKLRDSFYRTRLVRLVVPFFLKKPTVERAGQGPPRLRFQLPLVAAHEDEEREEAECRQCERDKANRPGEPLQVIPQEVASQAVARGPDDASQSIEEQEAFPLHAIGSRQECRPHAQHRHEAPEEDDFAAMPAEVIEAQLELALIQADEVRVSA